MAVLVLCVQPSGTTRGITPPERRLDWAEIGRLHGCRLLGYCHSQITGLNWIGLGESGLDQRSAVWYNATAASKTGLADSLCWGAVFKSQMPDSHAGNSDCCVGIGDVTGMAITFIHSDAL